MARQQSEKFWMNFIGGLNTAVSADVIADTELRSSNNMRHESPGAMAPRNGTLRLHASAIGSGNPVRGVFQWDAPSVGKQLVAIANGKLYHKATLTGAFTEVTPGAGDEFSTTLPAFFAPFRAASSGASLILYISSGDKTYKWTGSALTRIDGTNAVPDSDFLEPYHTRMFYHDPAFKKHVFWSKIGDAETCTYDGLPANGGQAMVDTLSGEAITRIMHIGSSLLVATDDSIAVFAGHSDLDITINEDTEGVAAETGIVSSRAIARLEKTAVLLADKGFYEVSESDIQEIGQKIISNGVLPISASVLSTTMAVHHRGRKEVWFLNYSTPTTTAYVWSEVFRNWTTFTFTNLQVTSVSRYEDANGKELVVAGCADGFVRLLDSDQSENVALSILKDDVLSDGTGGSAYTGSLTLAEFIVEPQKIKAARQVWLQVRNPAGATTFTVNLVRDGVSTTVGTSATATTGIENQRLDVDNTEAQFNRAQFSISWSISGVLVVTDKPAIHGLGFTYDVFERFIST